MKREHDVFVNFQEGEEMQTAIDCLSFKSRCLGVRGLKFDFSINSIHPFIQAQIMFSPPRQPVKYQTWALSKVRHSSSRVVC